MPTRSSYTLFTFRGTPVGVDWTWLLVLFFVVWFLSGYYRSVLDAPEGAFEPYALAVVTALLFFASILLHELGHAVVAMRNGIGITHITLWLFGGIAGLQRDAQSAGVEFRIAAAGPLVTLVIAAACLGGGMLLDSGAFVEGATLDADADVSGPVAVLAWLGNINLIILLFNLLPAFPLDGGRIARAAAWKLTGDREKATGFAARLGQIFAAGFAGFGLFVAIAFGQLVWGIWLAVIGWLLFSAAQATVVRNELNRRINAISVADVMERDPVAIPRETPVEQALEQYFLRYDYPWFPVVDAGRAFLGLVKRGAADGVPESSRGYKRIDELVDVAAAPAQQVGADEPIENLLGNPELRRLGAIVAVDANGRLAGLISVERLGRALREAVGEDGLAGGPR
jgi:Zn-dependent protease